MGEMLDLAIVICALVGAAWFIVRRFWRRGGAAACNTGCGQCGPGEGAAKPAPAAQPLVQLGHGKRKA